MLCTGTCAQRCSAPTFLTAVSRPRRRRLGPRDPVNAWSKLSGATRSNGDTDRSTHAVHQHHGTRDENEHGHGNETKRNETKTIPRKENFHPYRDPPPLSFSLSLSLCPSFDTIQRVDGTDRSTINDQRSTIDEKLNDNRSVDFWKDRAAGGGTRRRRLRRDRSIDRTEWLLEARRGAARRSRRDRATKARARSARTRRGPTEPATVAPTLRHALNKLYRADSGGTPRPTVEDLSLCLRRRLFFLSYAPFLLAFGCLSFLSGGLLFSFGFNFADFPVSPGHF